MDTSASFLLNNGIAGILDTRLLDVRRNVSVGIYRMLRELEGAARSGALSGRTVPITGPPSILTVDDVKWIIEAATGARVYCIKGMRDSTPIVWFYSDHEGDHDTSDAPERTPFQTGADDDDAVLDVAEDTWAVGPDPPREAQPTDLPEDQDEATAEEVGHPGDHRADTDTVRDHAFLDVDDAPRGVSETGRVRIEVAGGTDKEADELLLRGGTSLVFPGLGAMAALLNEAEVDGDESQPDHSG
jgi:hypothetical protein